MLSYLPSISLRMVLGSAEKRILSLQRASAERAHPSWAGPAGSAGGGGAGQATKPEAGRVTRQGRPSGCCHHHAELWFQSVGSNVHRGEPGSSNVWMSGNDINAAVIYAGSSRKLQGLIRIEGTKVLSAQAGDVACHGC